MGRNISKDELKQHKEDAMKKLGDYLDFLIESADSKENGKADKLSYWLEDWTTFLGFEQEFSPRSLRRYKRGEIIKVHLGFNVGSEEGGLHYAIVLDKNNAKSSPVVTIAPLTSVKPHTDLSNLKKGSIFLGNELFTNLNAKISATKKHVEDELALLIDLLNKGSSSMTANDLADINKRITKCRDDLELHNRMSWEVRRMRIGSIALINQITTVSKIRIYDPKTDHDILSGIKLSNEKLDLIDQTVKELFVK